MQLTPLTPLAPGQTYDRAGNIIPAMPSYGDPSSFGGAAQKQTSDYDRIMANYQSLFNAPSSTPISGSISNLSDLATTGGYSPSAISDLRARAVSPVRSIYATAQQNLERQKALQGGYSPGYTAATAKMARDEAGQISGALTNVNAGIAQNVAQNRLAAASPYASAEEFNASLANQDLFRKMQATEGMRGMYGTTPALVSTFGQQVAGAAGLGQGQQELNLRNRLGTMQAVAPLVRG